MAFPPGFLDELRARLSLSEVVGRKVALKRKSGAEYLALCPFHNEKTPSFTVNEKKGFFHCFGCGAHGDAVGFVMKTEGLSYPESVEKLAREVNLQVPSATRADRERAERTATLQQVVEEAARWFQKQLRLPVGRQGLDYLRGRGLEDVTIDDFRLGFAPDSREGLVAHLKRENIPVDKIVEAGLAVRPEDSDREPYDRFRGRVMFPITDRRGRVIAFGGRVLGPREPKYLNSPETPLFHKGANLYCLDRAREAAARGKPVIVTEGYMDVIALHVAGFTGAVAALGTALTEDQLAQLWKFSDEPYLCFDGDNAGKRAADRAIDRALPLLRAGKSLRFLSLPPGEDPDSLIRTRGADAMLRSLDLARPLSDMVWSMETEGKPLDTPERRADLERALEKRVDEIADPVVRNYYRTEMRNRLRPLRRPERPRWQAGQRRFSRGDGPEPAPFAAGSAARRAGLDLDGSRQLRNLLGALLERPAMLHVLAEDVATLPPVSPELDRLRGGLLDALSLFPRGIDPAAEESLTDGSGVPLEARLIKEHLERLGLGRLAAAARTRAREAFRAHSTDDDGWENQWRRMARHLRQLVSAPEELRRAQDALARDLNDENLGVMRAILDRMRKESAESDTG